MNPNTATTKTRVVLDVRKLVHRFGGPLPLSKRLIKMGHDISVKGINMWIWRQSMPAGWLPLLSLLAEEEGRPLRLQDYMRQGDSVEDLPDFLE